MYTRLFLASYINLSYGLGVLWQKDYFTPIFTYYFWRCHISKLFLQEVKSGKVYLLLFQEIPYGIEHRLVDWKEFRDGSLRIEQHFITHKMSQRKILVGKKGSKIGYVHNTNQSKLRPHLGLRLFGFF